MATKTAQPTASVAATEKAPEWNAERLDDLLRRIELLERTNEAMLSGKVAEISQEERDRRILSRRPNSYPEAVEYEAARLRQAERDENRPDGEKDEAEDPAKAQPSTPPSSQSPAPVAR